MTFAGREKADHSLKLCRETQSCMGAAGIATAPATGPAV